MTEETLSKRWHDLDALRGFAMLLGIVLHAAMSFLGGVWSVDDIHSVACTECGYCEFYRNNEKDKGWKSVLDVLSLPKQQQIFTT